MSKNTNISELINYISVDGSGNVVLSSGQLVATQNYVSTAITNLVNSAPSTLDTLNELATALGNDANFATTVSTSIGNRVPYTGANADVVLGSNNLKSKNTFVEGDGLYNGGGLRIKQYAFQTDGIDGYNTISSQTSGFAFSSSRGNGVFNNFILDPTSLPNNTQRSYILPNANGTLALTSDIPTVSGVYVPYTGATANVSLGNYELGAKYITSEGSSGLGGVVNIKQDAISMPKGNGYSSIAANLSSFDFWAYTGASTYKYFQLRFDGLTNGTTRLYTLPNADGTLALTSNLSSYLPLAGGTLTGNLTIGGFTIAELGTGYKGIQLQDSTGGLLSGSSYAVYLTSNAIIGTTGWIRGGAAYATARYSQFDGQHIFYTAAASSAGSAITWNTVFTIASTGAATFSNSITAGTYNLNSGGVVNINSQNGFQLGADTYSGGFYIYDNTTGVYRFKIANGGAVTISGILGIGVSPSYPLDMLTSSSGTFNTIAQFQNNDYTANNRSFIRVRQWVNAGGSSSSYFGTGQDSNLYIIANNSARGGDLIINAGTGDATFSSKLGVGVTPYSQLSLPSGNGWNGGLSWNYTTNGADSRRWWINTDQIVYGDFRICTEQTRGGGTINSAGSLYERFYIDASGRTGIGTTSLNASGLTIYQAGSDQRVLLELNRPNNSGLQTSLQFTVGNSIMVGQIQHEYAASNQNHMSFSLRSPSGSNFVSMWLKNDGNIGMGTNNPYTRLDVRGSIGMGGGATYPLNARLVKQGSTSVTFTATLGTIGAWRPGHIMIKVSGGQNGLQEYWAAWFFVRIIAYVGSSVICTVVDSGGDTGSVSFSSTSDASNSPQTATFTLTDGGGTTNTMIADIDLTYNEGIVSLS